MELIAFIKERSDQEVSEILEKNAVCSLKRGISCYLKADDTSVKYKYSLIHIAHGLEISLKSILAKQGRFLILKRPDQNNKTVNVTECLKRLDDYDEVSLSDDDKDVIEAIREHRNWVEHFALVGNKTELDCAITGALVSTISFMKEHSDIKLNALLSREEIEFVSQLDAEHERIEKEAEARMRRWGESLSEEEKKDWTLPKVCRYCFKKTKVVGNETSKCYFCGFEEKIGRCPNCDNRKILRRFRDAEWLCYRCEVP